LQRVPTLTDFVEKWVIRKTKRAAKSLSFRASLSRSGVEGATEVAERQETADAAGVVGEVDERFDAPIDVLINLHLFACSNVLHSSANGTQNGLSQSRASWQS
jgi:hypothetical protein